MVDTLDIDDNKSTRELCRDVAANKLDRDNGWEDHRILSSHEDDIDGHDWYRINVRYQPAGKRHSTIYIAQAGRSEGLEYIVSAETDERRIAEYAADIDHMLASFRFRGSGAHPEDYRLIDDL